MAGRVNGSPTEQITSLDIKRGWYMSTDKKGGTPNDWVFTTFRNMSAWGNCEKMREANREPICSWDGQRKVCMTYPEPDCKPPHWLFAFQQHHPGDFANWIDGVGLPFGQLIEVHKKKIIAAGILITVAVLGIGGFYTYVLLSGKKKPKKELKLEAPKGVASGITITSVQKGAEEDDWNEGADPSTYQTILEEAVNKNFASLREAIEYTEQNWDFPGDPDDWDPIERGRITTNRTENAEGYEPTRSEMEKFEKGKQRMWLAHLDIYVTINGKKPSEDTLARMLTGTEGEYSEEIILHSAMAQNRQEQRTREIPHIWKQMAYIDRKDILEQAGISDPERVVRFKWSNLKDRLGADELRRLEKELENFWAWKFSSPRDSYTASPVFVSQTAVFEYINPEEGSDKYYTATQWHKNLFPAHVHRYIPTDHVHTVRWGARGGSTNRENDYHFADEIITAISDALTSAPGNKFMIEGGFNGQAQGFLNSSAWIKQVDSKANKGYRREFTRNLYFDGDEFSDDNAKPFDLPFAKQNYLENTGAGPTGSQPEYSEELIVHAH